MKLTVLEGPIDLQFFKSFVIKQMGGKVVTKENRELVNMFKNLLAENSEMARVECLSVRDGMLILLSAGSKSNFKIIARGIRPLIDALRKEGQNISSILYVADMDAEPEVMESEKIIREKLASSKSKVNIGHLFYCNYFEDVILKIVDIMVAEGLLGNEDIELLQKLIKIFEKRYNSDKYLHKRKVGIVHAIIGPRCFGHLFDEIFQRFDNSNHLLLEETNILVEYTRWLSED